MAMIDQLGQMQGMQTGVQLPPNLTQMLGGPNAITGGAAMQGLMDYRSNMNTEQAMNQMIMQRNQAQAEEDRLSGPMRAEQRLGEIARQKADAATIMELKRAEADIKGTQAKKGKAVVESEIAAENAGNEAKRMEAMLKQHEDKVEELYRDFGDSKSPTALSDVTKWFDTHGVGQNDPVRQHVMGATSTQDMNARIKSVRDRIVNSVGSARKMIEERAKTELENKGKTDVAGINAGAHIKAAEIAAAAHKYGADKSASGKAMNQSQYDASMATVLNKIGDKDETQLSEVEQEAVQWGIQRAETAWEKAVSAGKLASLQDMANMGGPTGKKAATQLEAAKAQFTARLPKSVQKGFSAQPATQLPADVQGTPQVEYQGRKIHDLGGGRFYDPAAGRYGKTK